MTDEPNAEKQADITEQVPETETLAKTEITPPVHPIIGEIDGWYVKHIHANILTWESQVIKTVRDAVETLKESIKKYL